MDNNQNSIVGQNEMMMFNSLPISTIILDNESNLLKINQAAQEFLKIDNAECYYGKELKFVTDYIYLSKIIEEIQCGKTITNKKVLIRKFDDNISIVDFFACSLQSADNAFLFQFVELNPSNDIKFEFVSKTDNTQLNSNLQQISATEKRLLNNLVQKQIVDRLLAKPLYAEFLGEDVLLKISNKYPQLSESDIIVCGLISLRKSTSEISLIIDKTPNCTRVITHRIINKLNLKSRRELCNKLVF